MHHLKFLSLSAAQFMRLDARGMLLWNLGWRWRSPGSTLAHGRQLALWQ